MGVVDRDTDQSPRAHHTSEGATIRLRVAAGAVTEHDRGEWSAAARLEQDALEIDGRTVQRSDERPRRPGRRFGIPGDRESGVAGGAGRHTDHGVAMARSQHTQHRGDQGGPERAAVDPLECYASTRVG